MGRYGKVEAQIVRLERELVKLETKISESVDPMEIRLLEKKIENLQPRIDAAFNRLDEIRSEDEDFEFEY